MAIEYMGLNNIQGPLAVIEGVDDTFYEEMIKEYSSYPDKTDYYIDETLVEKVLLNQEFNYLEQTYYEMGEGYTNNLDALPDIYFWEEHIYRTPTNNVDLKLTFYKVKKYFKQLGQIWIQ